MLYVRKMKLSVRNLCERRFLEKKSYEELADAVVGTGFRRNCFRSETFFSERKKRNLVACTEVTDRVKLLEQKRANKYPYRT